MVAELSEEEWRLSVEGRLVAIEHLLVGIMTTQFGSMLPDPVGQLPDVRRTYFGSLQNLSRDVSAESDLAWEHAVKALNMHFDNVARRLESVGRHSV